VNDGLDLIVLGAHCDTDALDAATVVRERRVPRHRARRARWKPPRGADGLQPVDAKHAYDRDALVG
jgi:hypothetical protein